MDDHKSRQQIDELAELYLTRVVDDSFQQENTMADNPVEGPAPIRLAPKLGVNEPTGQDDVNADRAHAYQEPDDRHPVLRLTEGDDESENENQDTLTADQPGAATMDAPATELREQSNPEPAPQALVEAVLLGNLPGMSGPWLTQYAQLLAQTDGPVAILHVGDNAIDLELVEPRIEAQPKPAQPMTAVRIPPMRGNKSGLVGLLDALTRSETAPTRTILVRIETPADVQTLSRLAALDDWTLLCGSDDTAIAGAAQQLRTLVRADPRLADRSVGLMVMGSDEQASRDAAGRVAHDVEDDLANPVELIGHLKRMQPVQVREIGSFPDPIELWPQLVGWFDTLEAPEPMPLPTPQPEPAMSTPASAPTFEPAPAPVTPAPPLKPQRLSDEAAKLGTPAAPAMPASRPEPIPTFRQTPPPAQPAAPRQAPPRQATPRQPAPASASARPAPQTQAAQQPAPQPTAQPAAPRVVQATQPTRPAPQPRVLSPQPELDLVALLAQGPAALDQPAALEARIPDQPTTQLAVDAQGVVHILLKKGTVPFIGGVDSDAASSDPRAAVLQLIEAGRWVQEHLELLALTQRDRDFIDEAPVLHLFTDRADLSTQLVGKLAGQVKLHLLQQVQLGRESGWFCTPLG